MLKLLFLPDKLDLSDPQKHSLSLQIMLMETTEKETEFFLPLQGL